MDCPSPGGRDVLLAPGCRPQKVAHFVVSSAETMSAIGALKAAHRPRPFRHLLRCVDAHSDRA
jgi:hypothetical protein